MKIRKLTHCFWAKAVAIALLIALSFACLVSAGACAYFELEAGNVSDSAGSYAASPFFSYMAEPFADRALSAYRYDGASALFPQSNFRYTITDEASGEVVATNLAPGERTAKCTYTRRYTDTVPTPVTGMPEARTILLEGTLLTPMTQQDAFARQAYWYGRAYEARDAMLPAALVLFAVCLLLFAFLMCASGRHSDSPEPRLGALDRIPADLLIAVVAGICFLLLHVTVFVVDLPAPNVFRLGPLVLIPLYCLGMLLLIGGSMSIATRIKTRTLLSNTLIAYVLRFLWRVLRAVARGLAAFFASLPLLWQVVVGIGAYWVVNLLLVALTYGGGGAFGLLLFLAFNGAAFVLAIRVALEMNKLRQGGAAIAAGNTAFSIATEKMLPLFRKHGENLNAINSGIAAAVEQRMKSERMKTDLITNVSHDLKTPLTSIVTYVDLLRKEPLPEQAASYVEVLDRQAQRLKKLTEDVVDASKASSGAMPVELVPTDAAEILMQSLAEYESRLSAVPLTAVVDTPTAPVLVLADGRLLWRVFDNLLGNIVKYAMPGTRVYLTVAQTGCDAVVSLKNISRDALNISAEELMDRFVQGDASRTGSGSGLGLSIAKSLVELQHGTLALSIDGDLFTARITFAKLADPA